MIDSGKLPSTSIPGSPTKGSLENKTVKAPVKNKKEAVKELKGVSRIESLYRDRYFGEKQKKFKAIWV